MRKIFIFVCLFSFAIGSSKLNAQKLGKFGAEMGKKSFMGKEIRIPYTDLVNYFGYIAPGTKSDAAKDGKNIYYLYVWISAVAPEIGIRMISPIPKKMKASSKDFTSPTFEANKEERDEYFDTWLVLEKAQGIVKAEDITKGGDASWNILGTNDDSSEMPANPSGSKYNSLMRITSEASNPLKALTVGLYRIGFTTYKKGEVKGSFFVQIGAPIKLPGTAIATNLEELQKQVKK